ncbi:hypothetical protein LTR66_014860, partial [Elasticomyces elasticus]
MASPGQFEDVSPDFQPASSSVRQPKTATFTDEINAHIGDQKAVPEWRDPEEEAKRQLWTLGIKADDMTDEVPGTVLLLSKYSAKNIPLGLHHEQSRGRSITRGSISAEAGHRRSSVSADHTAKKTTDGRIVLDPQPEDSMNDPLNWPSWRRDAALLSLGFYCMLGGGMTPILAAGFNEVASSLNVSYADVARTTGLYMMGMGVGGVLVSPTAILYGKRPVYLASAILFIVTSVWCAVAPSYAQLATARVFQGIAVSPVEVLPSATIAEIFFLHERAFRVGVYTLLLLGGKNLVSLVSAVIIQDMDWRWVFYIVAIIVAFGGFMLFLFAPETFWDRAPRPRAVRRKSTSRPRHSIFKHSPGPILQDDKASPRSSTSRSRSRDVTIGRVSSIGTGQTRIRAPIANVDGAGRRPDLNLGALPTPQGPLPIRPHAHFAEDDPAVPHLHNLNSPYYVELEKNTDYMDFVRSQGGSQRHTTQPIPPQAVTGDEEKHDLSSVSEANATHGEVTSPQQISRATTGISYTTDLRRQPPKPYLSTLKPWNGRLNKSTWWKAAVRPFILYAYPGVLWAALCYSLSIGWLIVLSESVSNIYKNRETYNFTSLQIGLVYLSPFIGAILGTAVAGKLSDVVVRFMARRNNGIYEPEYRLVMTLPIVITTVAGLMGFGWSAQEHDAWIVPTVFFGIISFGCSLGSTTAITFCVDSYRQFAGEALVTLNFSKNIFHGLVFSLFFPTWLEHDGPKDVFVAIGGIQLACLLVTIP